MDRKRRARIEGEGDEKEQRNEEANRGRDGRRCWCVRADGPATSGERSISYTFYPSQGKAIFSTTNLRDHLLCRQCSDVRGGGVVCGVEGSTRRTRIPIVVDDLTNVRTCG